MTIKPKVNRIPATAIGWNAVKLILIAAALPPHIKAKNRTANTIRNGILTDVLVLKISG